VKKPKQKYYNKIFENPNKNITTKSLKTQIKMIYKPWKNPNKNNI